MTTVDNGAQPVDAHREDVPARHPLTVYFVFRPLGLLMLAALAASVVAVLVLGIGFSSIRFVSGEPSKAGSQAAKEKHSPAAARDDASKTTALKVSAIHAPFYVKGSDGKAHLEYDLVSTSVVPYPVTLTKVVVMAGDGRKLLTLEGDALEARTQPLGELNTFSGTREVASSGSVATLMDVKVPPDKVPERITHRITYELPPDTPKGLKAIIDSLTIKGPKLDVSRRPATVIAPPLSGKGWLNLNGCCFTTAEGHRSHRLAVDGRRIVTPETFAIDFSQVQGTRFYKGDGTRNEQYFAYGAKVSSVANGKVVFVRDGLPEQTPNAAIVGVERTLDFGGNQVVVRIGGARISRCVRSPWSHPYRSSAGHGRRKLGQVESLSQRCGVYAQYYHLQPGSIDVQKGEHVKTGQLLGKLGNSGNSSGPHLHFGLSTGPEALTSDSLPFVFDRYTWAGSVDLEKSTLPNLLIEGTPRTERKSYPLDLSLADFR
jgi:hypothetical protein